MRDLGTLLEVDSAGEDVSVQFKRHVTPEPEQAAALKMSLDWVEAAVKSPAAEKPEFILAGYAGTGKTLVTGLLAAELGSRMRIAFCCFTGRAASVLARSLDAAGVRPRYCGTIHRLIYRAVVDEKTRAIVGWNVRRDLKRDYDLIIVDEASMVSSDLLRDLRACGVPILAVGDHGQLPPVGEDVGLMADPDFALTKVHRQALDNPVLALSVLIRSGGNWRRAVRGCADKRLRYVSKLDMTGLVMDAFEGAQKRPVSSDPLVMCGINRTRRALNDAARTGLGSEPVVGDRVTCFKNAYLSGAMLANGWCGRVEEPVVATEHWYRTKVSFADEKLELVGGALNKLQFRREKQIQEPEDVGLSDWETVGLLFDFGYATTVHRAQGSQRRSAILVVEDFQDSAADFLRWAYSGVTRAAEELVMVF